MAPTLENTIGRCQQKQPSVTQQMTTTTTTPTTQPPLANNIKRTPELVTGGVDLIEPKGDIIGAHGEFKRMLDKLERAFSRSSSSVDVDEIWRILEEYESNVDEWAKYAYYDMTKYKRNLVAEYDKYNVMIICWGPGSRSCIHDHAGSHCFMKVLDGELIEGRFAWPDETTLAGIKSQEMSRVMDTRMHLNDVVYIHDKVGLHLVENVNPNKTAASLHVYIPPYRECKAFDQRTGRAIECKLKFHSKCGRVIGDDENQPRDKFEC